MGTLFSSESRKAWLSGAIAFAGSLAVAAQDNSLVMAEWIAAVAVALVALGGVYGIKNADAK